MSCHGILSLLLLVLTRESCNKTISQATPVQRWIQQRIMTIFSGDAKQNESCVWETRLSPAPLKAISVGIINSTFPFRKSVKLRPWRQFPSNCIKTGTNRWWRRVSNMGDMCLGTEVLVMNTTHGLWGQTVVLRFVMNSVCFRWKCEDEVVWMLRNTQSHSLFVDLLSCFWRFRCGRHIREDHEFILYLSSVIFHIICLSKYGCSHATAFYSSCFQMNHWTLMHKHSWCSLLPKCKNTQTPTHVWFQFGFKALTDCAMYQNAACDPDGIPPLIFMQISKHVTKK